MDEIVIPLALLAFGQPLFRFEATGGSDGEWSWKLIAHDGGLDTLMARDTAISPEAGCAAALRWLANRLAGPEVPKTTAPPAPTPRTRPTPATRPVPPARSAASAINEASRRRAARDVKGGRE